MSTIDIKINTENAAFEDDNRETVRILKELADNINESSVVIKNAIIKDINGNNVGNITSSSIQEQ